MIENKEKTTKIIVAGLMMAMIVVATILIIIPVPFGNGYIHLGDAIIFLSVLILGWEYGAVAAGVGSALADILVGYAIWAPWTLFIKG
ncbi:MAG: ECF transporter S component, partial [Eubacteriales bacterium]|nr:ECF transporter S component [Eubacteriales bacterium]